MALYPTVAPPPTYRFVIYDSVSGNALTEVPSMTRVTYSYGLNGAGKFSGTLSLDDKAADPVFIQTLSREIGVWRNGQPYFVGPITKVTLDTKQWTITIDAQPVWWYMSKRSNELALSYTNQDLGFIVWDILNVAMSKSPGGSIRLTKDAAYPASTGTSLTIDPTIYPGLSNVSTDPISKTIETLGQGNPGFDFMILLAGDNFQGINRTFNIYTPFKSAVIDTPVATDNGVAWFSMTDDGEQVMARVSEIGGSASDTSSILVSRANSAALTNGSIPMIEGIQSRSDADQQTLDLYAQGDLYLHQWPMRTFSATYQVNAAMPFGFANPGDLVPFQVTAGKFSYTGTHRLTELSVALAGNTQAGGDEEVTLTFNQPADGSGT